MKEWNINKILFKIHVNTWFFFILHKLKLLKKREGEKTFILRMKKNRRDTVSHFKVVLRHTHTHD